MLPLPPEVAFLFGAAVAAALLRLRAGQERAYVARLEDLVRRLERLREIDNEPDGR